MPPPASLQGIPVISPAATAGSDLPVTAPTSGSGGSTGSPADPIVAATLGAPAGDGASSELCNLLPSLGLATEAASPAGIYVGEGLLPVPAKLAERIKKWEFVDMAELLPEFWATPGPKESLLSGTPRPAATRRKRVVTDIATWVQCFATYVSVMSTAHQPSVGRRLLPATDSGQRLIRPSTPYVSQGWPVSANAATSA